MKRNLFKIASVVALGFASTSFAVTDDGDIGTTSTGTADISLTIPKLIQITGMKDVAFTDYVPGENDRSLSKNICIYGNFDTSETYQVRAHGDGAANAFTIARQGTGTAWDLPYHVYYNTSIAGGEGTEFTSSNSFTVTGRGGFSNSVLDPCPEGQENAKYTVKILKNDILAARYGTYRGTLTLVVEPEPVTQP